jgi:hypothetical protein
MRGAEAPHAASFFLRLRDTPIGGSPAGGIARHRRQRQFDPPTTLRIGPLAGYRAEFTKLDPDEKRVTREFARLVQEARRIFGRHPLRCRLAPHDRGLAAHPAQPLPQAVGLDDIRASNSAARSYGRAWRVVVGTLRVPLSQYPACRLVARTTTLSATAQLA